MSGAKIIGGAGIVLMALFTFVAIREHEDARTFLVRSDVLSPSEHSEANARMSEHREATSSRPIPVSPQVADHSHPAMGAAKRLGAALDPAYVARVKHDAAVVQMNSNFGDFIAGAHLTEVESALLLDLLAEERQAALELIVSARDRGIYWRTSQTSNQ